MGLRLAKIIKNVSVGNPDGRLSYNILKACAMPWTLRRCAQTTTTSGNPLVNIPPMTVTKVRLEFTHTYKERLKRFIEKKKKKITGKTTHWPSGIGAWLLASNLMDEPLQKVTAIPGGESVGREGRFFDGCMKT
jgi:hypothetical protein